MKTRNTGKTPEKAEVVKTLVSHSVPAVFCIAITALCNVTDRLFIGDTEGVTALAGLALTLPFMVLFTAVGSLIGTGASMLLSEISPTENKETTGEITTQAFILTLVLSLLLILLSIPFLKEILLLFGGRKDTIPYAVRYLHILIPGSIFFNFIIGFGHCLRIHGYLQKISVLLFCSFFLNALADYFLVKEEAYTIERSAYTTVFCLFAAGIPLLHHLFSRNTPVVVHPRYFRFNILLTRRIISAGMTSFFMNLTICTVSIIMNNYLVVYGGTMAIGAFGIISSYTMIMLMVIAGICQGMQFTSRSKGKAERLRIFKVTLALTGGVSLLVFIGGEVFSEDFIYFFTRDSRLSELTSTGLPIILSTFPILGFQLIIAGFFQSVSKTRKALFINMSRQFVFLIPLLFLFSGFWGLTGIWLAIPVSDLLAMTVSGILLHLEKQKDYEAIDLILPPVHSEKP